MSEKVHIENAVVERAEAQGWFVRKVAWAGRRRAPDRLFIKARRTIWMEFKDRGKKAREDQNTEHEEMRAAGAEVFVVDSVREGCMILGLPFTPDPLRPHL